MSEKQRLAWQKVEGSVSLKACPNCGGLNLEGFVECAACGCEPQDDQSWRTPPTAEEWAEVEVQPIGRCAWIYRRCEGSPGYEVAANGATWGGPNTWEGRDPYAFVAGMEAARQEIREKLERVLVQLADEASLETIPEDASDFTRRYCVGMGEAVRVIRANLSPPDSETES